MPMHLEQCTFRSKSDWTEFRFPGSGRVVDDPDITPIREFRRDGSIRPEFRNPVIAAPGGFDLG